MRVSHDQLVSKKNLQRAENSNRKKKKSRTASADARRAPAPPTQPAAGPHAPGALPARAQGRPNRLRGSRQVGRLSLRARFSNPPWFSRNQKLEPGKTAWLAPPRARGAAAGVPGAQRQPRRARGWPRLALGARGSRHSAGGEIEIERPLRNFP